MQAVDRQLDLGRSLQIWLNMQNGVNALFDSTSTPQNLGTQVWSNSLLHGLMLAEEEEEEEFYMRWACSVYDVYDSMSMTACL